MMGPRPRVFIARRHCIPDAMMIIEKSMITKPIGYISQDIFEYAKELGLNDRDAAYMVELYNEDLLWWGTGYYAEMRGIPWEKWSALRMRFEVRE